MNTNKNLNNVRIGKSEKLLNISFKNDVIWKLYIKERKKENLLKTL